MHRRVCSAGSSNGCALLLPIVPEERAGWRGHVSITRSDRELGSAIAAGERIRSPRIIHSAAALPSLRPESARPARHAHASTTIYRRYGPAAQPKYDARHICVTATELRARQVVRHGLRWLHRGGLSGCSSLLLYYCPPQLPVVTDIMMTTGHLDNYARAPRGQIRTCLARPAPS